jgi:hypothetical protein
MSAWISHIKSVFNKNRKTNKAYTYKSAMKDAAKTYTKSNDAKTGKGTKRSRSTRRKR